MKKFTLSACVTVSAITEIVAETKEEALKIADNRPVEMGDERNGAYPIGMWVIGEADGEPQDVIIVNEEEATEMDIEDWEEFN